MRWKDYRVEQQVRAEHDPGVTAAALVTVYQDFERPAGVETRMPDRAEIVAVLQRLWVPFRMRARVEEESSLDHVRVLGRAFYRQMRRRIGEATD